MASYFGKFRAKVIDVSDPEKRGRIRVQCPKVLGNSKSAWCEVCVPIAFDEDGDFCLPPVGEMVWVEFEEGNPNKPILVGGWFSKEKTPKKDYDDAPNERIISFKGNKISMKKDLLTLITADEKVEVSLTKDDITIDFKGSSKVTLKSGNVSVEAGGVSCSFTAGSLTTLKTLIGG